MSSFAYHTAGDFCTGISGGLAMVIIETTVNHDGSSKHIPNPKPICQNCKIGSPTGTQQHGKISGVIRMFVSGRIIMPSGIRKAIAAAVRPLMNMKGKKACLGFRQAADLRLHQDTLPRLTETNHTTQLWMIFASPDKSLRIGSANQSHQYKHP